jgi:hypothetical protein
MKRFSGFIIVLTMVFAVLGSSGVAVSSEKAGMKDLRIAAIGDRSWNIPPSFAFDTSHKEKSTPLTAVMSPQDFVGP